jgi:hypothetical protein
LPIAFGSSTAEGIGELVNQRLNATLRGELIAILDLPRKCIVTRPPHPEL